MTKKLLNMKKNHLVLSILLSNLFVLLLSYPIFRLSDGKLGDEHLSNEKSIEMKRNTKSFNRDLNQPSDSELFQNREKRVTGLGESLSAVELPETRVNQSGGLSSGLIREFNISQEQFVKSQLVLSSYWADMAAWAAKSVFFDSTASSSMADGANVFRLPAMDREERDVRLAALTRELGRAANKEMAEAIVKDLKKSQAFAGMGKYDVIFKFRRRESQEIDPETLQPIGDPVTVGNDATVEYSYINPITGNVILTSNGGDVGQVASEFGDIFKMD